MKRCSNSSAEFVRIASESESDYISLVKYAGFHTILQDIFPYFRRIFINLIVMHDVWNRDLSPLFKVACRTFVFNHSIFKQVSISCHSYLSYRTGQSFVSWGLCLWVYLRNFWKWFFDFEFFNANLWPALLHTLYFQLFEMCVDEFPLGVRGKWQVLAAMIESPLVAKGHFHDIVCFSRFETSIYPISFFSDRVPSVCCVCRILFFDRGEHSLHLCFPCTLGYFGTQIWRSCSAESGCTERVYYQ